MLNAVGKVSILILLLSFCGSPPLSASETTPAQVLDVQAGLQAEAQASQSRIDQLDDETLSMLSEYNTETAKLESLRTYNNNLREMLSSQAREKSRLEQALADIEVTRREIVPLMTEMIDVMAQFIELDLPMLGDERAARLARLEENMSRSDIDLAEKYRRVVESYQIEAEYGQSIEAYEGRLSLDDRDLTVDFLRIGRAALYFISLDRSEAGIWNTERGRWDTLSGEHLDNLDYAIRVARKQAPPDLMPLPLWTPSS